MADLLNVEKLQLFLVIMLPGFVAIKVHDRLAPPEKRDFGSSLIEAVAYGLINFAAWAWLLVGLCVDQVKANPGWYSILFFVVCVVSPALLAWLTHYLRKRKWVCKYLGVPTKTAWDDFFNRQEECWVICHLKNGKLIAGLYSANSFASVYPYKPELYIEKTYFADEHGKITGEVPDSMGMLVRYEGCHLIEFLKVERPNG